MGRYARLGAVVCFLGVVLLAAELSGLREHFSLDNLHQMLARHLGSGLALFVLLFVLGNLIQVPGWIFLSAAVLALGRTWGGVATYLAANIACAVTFLSIRTIGSDALRRLENPLARRLLGQLDAKPVQSIALLRILFQTLPALNYALALSGVNFRKYMVGTLLGLPLPIMAYCLFFDFVATRLGLGGP